LNLKDRLDEKVVDNKDIERKIIQRVKERIRTGKYLTNFIFHAEEELKDELFLIVKEELDENFNLSINQIKDDFLERIFYEVFGLGILEIYLNDKEVTDIFIQDKEMIIVKKGEKIFLGEVFGTIEDVYLVVDRIKESSGKTIDQRMPFLNTKLYDGSRCSIVIPPVSDKVYISIRIFNCLDFCLDDLKKTGMFDNRICGLLIKFVNEKKNIIIAGGMGTGKTTLLNTLAKLIPKTEFINIIQDIPEIKLSGHPFVRLLTTRSKVREIDNEINQEKLLYETLRMMADRIIIGEVRDSISAYQMLQALNTGHKGSFGTIHADSAIDAFIRLETLAMEYKQISQTVIRKLISRVIDVVIFLENELDDESNILRRKIKEVALIDKELDEGGEFKLTYL